MQWLFDKCSFVNFGPAQFECTSVDPRILLQSAFSVDKGEDISEVINWGNILKFWCKEIKVEVLHGYMETAVQCSIV